MHARGVCTCYALCSDLLGLYVILQSSKTIKVSTRTSSDVVCSFIFFHSFREAKLYQRIQIALHQRVLMLLSFSFNCLVSLKPFPGGALIPQEESVGCKDDFTLRTSRKDRLFRDVDQGRRKSLIPEVNWVRYFYFHLVLRCSPEVKPQSAVSLSAHSSPFPFHSWSTQT